MSLLKTTCKAADRIRIMSGRVAWTQQRRVFLNDWSDFVSYTCAHFQPWQVQKCFGENSTSSQHEPPAPHHDQTHADAQGTVIHANWILSSSNCKTHTHIIIITVLWLTQLSLPGSCGRGSRRGWGPGCSSAPTHWSPGLRYWPPPPGETRDALLIKLPTDNQKFFLWV